MLDAIFLILVVLWIGFRFLFRRWLRAKVGRRELTEERAMVLYAASVASIPLLAIPFVRVPDGWTLLGGVAVSIFVFQLAMTLLFWRFVKGSPVPK